jgi:putative endopeptidase
MIGKALIRPGDDFFSFVLERERLEPTVLPTGGAVEALSARIADELGSILRELSAGPRESDPEGLGHFYAAYMDLEQIEATGQAGLQRDIDRIQNLASLDDVVAFGCDPGNGVAFPIKPTVVLDQDNHQRYVLYLRQHGLGMPDREYYLDGHDWGESVRSRYVLHVKRVLELAGLASAARRAASVLALETEIARCHWTRARARERDLTFNRIRRSDLDTRSGFPWASALALVGPDCSDELVVRERPVVEDLPSLICSVPVSTWQSYFIWHLTRTMVEVLPAAFRDAHWSFFGSFLAGQALPSTRSRNAVVAVGDAFGHALGREYVRRHFADEDRVLVVEIVEKLRRAYLRRLQRADWLSTRSRDLFCEKLAAMTLKLGHPEGEAHARSFAVARSDAYGNVRRATKSSWDNEVTKLSNRTDRHDWPFLAHTVNAYYNPWFNEIVVPAGIVRAPFFDRDASCAQNLGAIGAVIAHEMSHAFDDQGCKFGRDGTFAGWASPRDRNNFEARARRVVAQYAAVEALPGLRLNSTLTVGEDIADICGLQVAYDALTDTYEATPPPHEVDAFFSSWARIWMASVPEAELRRQVISGPHTPMRWRCNGVVRNLDAWYATFGVVPGDLLFLDVAERVTIW